MEALLVRQSDIVKEIESIYTNFKKDGPSRRTRVNILKHISALEQLWTEFQNNNAQLQTSEDKSSEYFTKSIFERIRHYYEEATESIRKHLNPETKFEIPEFEGDGEDNEIGEMIIRQKANFRAFRRIMSRIKVDTIEERWEIEDALKNMQNRWNAIDELHLRIDCKQQVSDTDYDQEYMDLEDSFITIKRELNTKKSSTVYLKRSVPHVEIPIFTGDFRQWPTFNDLYLETIHNNKYLNNAQKMQHLKSKVKGEPERLIQHLYISADNYEVAWEILNHRYNNTQLLFTKQAEILLNQPNITKQTAFELKRLYDTTTECTHAIHNMGVNTKSWDPLLVHILSKKLDSDSYRDYKEARKEPRELPTMLEFLYFIENKFTALEPLHGQERKQTSYQVEKKQFTYQYSTPNTKPTYNKSANTQGRFIRKNYQYQAAPAFSRKQPCPVCNSNHDLFRCEQFLKTPTNKVMDVINRNQVCPNCLYKHCERSCMSSKRCKKCNGNHNTLIHEAVSQSNTYQPSTSQQRTAAAASGSPRALASNGSNFNHFIPNSTNQHQAMHVTSDNEEILLTTIVIKIKSSDNTYIALRALLDQGSQVSLISERAAQLLGLQRKYHQASVSGIGSSSKQSKGIVLLECQSIYEDYHFTTQALVISHIINNLPGTTFSKQAWPHIQRIDLADPEYNISKPIDLLLDASVYSDIIMEGLIKGPSTAPIAQQTRLGWILSGHVTKSFRCNVVTNPVNDLNKYWELEEIQPSTSTLLSPKEKYCEDYYQATTRRLEDGRYEVALPMKKDFVNHLGLSKPKAIAQFLQIERKMTRNPPLSEAYHKFMEEYEQLQHMRLVSQVTGLAHYLPHHGVVKPDSATTSLRVVFNASSPTSSGHSLNDLMECGPNLQQDLQCLILKWRQHKYVLTADIEKMFRQIAIRDRDQPLQSILWRRSPNELIQEYHLTTVTYGTKAAPFLAMRTLRQIAKDNPHLPLAAEALETSFYMDDLFVGSDSLSQAKELQYQLIESLKGAGMNLRKWSSNEPELIHHLSPELLSTTYEFKDTDTRKTLGLKWNPLTDTFSYQNRLECKEDANITKRKLLSEISKMYDPIGWLSPLTIRGKLLFQKTWLSKLLWDDKLPKDLYEEWSQLRGDLMSIDTYAIPRYVGQTNRSLTLHGFCDASERAYASAIYIVSQNSKGEHTSRLVIAKTRVAPTKKQVSLPRLELLGALLLSQLVQKVIESLSSSQINIKTHAWTDSMIVLGWRHGDVSKWKQFVANRVRQITDIIPSSCWRHVKSEENAADCATRGMTSTNLSSHSLWWKRPAWLPTFDAENISKISYQEPCIETKSKSSVNAALYQNHTQSKIFDLLHKCSSINKIAKTIAWVSRFVGRLRNVANTAHSSTLTANELQNAYHIIIKTVQGKEFEKDLSILKTKGHVHHKSNLSSLNPFIDEHGILRVGGRLRHSDLSYSAKHPIILSSKNRLTELIINQAHIETLHGGPKITLSQIREQYWVISGVRTIKKHLRRCIKCIRFKQENRQHIMAALPRHRVTPSRPFTNTGVDFTGHVEIKSNKGRGNRTSKGYVAVFVCVSTKATHLELVSDMSTASFLAAFRRMCARRGTPANVYSDNGTNFIGASRILDKEYQEILKSINTDFITNISEMGVRWHFNAPSWPSAGGLWEAAVKSLKYHLKRVLGEQRLTYEEFTTLLYQIEAILNSRPLCSLTESPEDTHLTPGHFLVGSSLISRPQTDSDVVNLSTRWNLIQTMNKQLWKRWSSEYLQQLQIRSKWRKQDQNLKIGDVVLIKEDNLPPGQWAMGRVCEVHPGPDGNIRVVSLKTKNKIIKRPISKLVVLPVNDYESQTNDVPQSQDHVDRPPTTDPIEQPSRRQLRPRRQFTLKNLLITTALLFMSIISYSHQSSYNITPIVNNNRLYFDKAADIQIMKDEWNMVIFYNMTPYWQAVTSLETNIRKLKKSCGEDHLSSILISQFEHEINEINHYNQLLTRRHETRSRVKRGLINSMGNIANALFGVLDDKFAEKYEQDIDTILQNEAHLLRLLKNQTSIIEADNNILRRNEQLMNKQFEAFNKQFNSISYQMFKIEKMSKDAIDSIYSTSIALAIEVIITNIRRIQETLLNTITDIYQGHIDIHLLSPEQLQEQLNVISGQLGNDLSIPVRPENIHQIYDLLHVRGKIHSKYLIIEIKIPLTTSATYELDYIISLPLKTNSRSYYVTTAVDYIAFDIRKDNFIPITAMDLFSCLKYQEGRLLCSLNVPIYQLKIDQSICDVKVITNESNQTFCTIKSINCTDRWIKLHASDSWLYSCCEECLVRITCPTGVTSHHLHGSGIIKLGQDCFIKGDTFTLQGHHDYKNLLYLSSSIQGIDLPQASSLNDFINTTVPLHILDAIEDHEKQFADIQRTLEAAKSSTISDVSSHHIHHYTMIYIMFVICIIFLGVIVYLFKRRGVNIYTKQEQQQQHELEASIATAGRVSRKAAAEPSPPVLARANTSISMEDVRTGIIKIRKSSSENNVNAPTTTSTQQKKIVQFNPPTFVE